VRTNISDGVFILSARDLDVRVQAAFRRGVDRGRFEERMAHGNEPVAINCANWRDGRCESCGVQSQFFEVGAEFRCPHFVRR
jgi:hypothetical protein